MTVYAKGGFHPETQVAEVIIERPKGELIRLIAIVADEDTGARSVQNIIEYTDNATGRNYAAQRVAMYADYSHLDVDVKATLNGNRVAIEEFDLGQAQKLTTKVKKVLEQADAQF